MTGSGAPAREGPDAAWSTALRVATLLAADPHGLGGVVVRAGPGPVRERWLAVLRTALGARPWRRMPPGIADDRMLGGLDLTATLAAGRPVTARGLLAEADGGVVVVPMAERLPAATAARLAGALDTGTLALEREGLAERLPARFGLILLDEGEGDEAVPEALADRLAFHLNLGSIRPGAVPDPAPLPGPRRPPPSAGEDSPPSGPDPIAALCTAAAALGIRSLRGPLLAARLARLLMAAGPAEDAVSEAACLVLAPRATRLPPQESREADGTAEEGAPDDPPPPEAAPEDPGAEPDPRPETEPAPTTAPLDEVVLEAARAALPSDLLARLAAGAPPRGAGAAGRFGQAARDPRTGRPVGARPGDPRRGRLDLIATLRAAAPWQRLRLATAESPAPIRIRPEDLRIRRLVRAPETTTVFCVDASGSAAMERLAEAKGAVELLLADAYIRRDRVALVAFRGRDAVLALPPTRSLVRAKRCLAGLPGGGGTPLAAGLDAAAAVAGSVGRAGGRAVVVVLTDGRANVARSGEGGRARAGAEAEAAARGLRALGVPVLVVDTGLRGEGARGIAEAAGARYCPLPYADAGRVSAMVRAVQT